MLTIMGAGIIISIFFDEVTQIQSLENMPKIPANKEWDDRVYNLFERPG